MERCHPGRRSRSPTLTREEFSPYSPAWWGGVLGKPAPKRRLPCKPSGAAVRSRLLVGGCTDPRGEPGFGDLGRCLVALRVTAVPGVIQCAMPTRLLSILVIVAVMSGCGASAEQIEAARLRIRVLASCLDEVAEGIGTGVSSMGRCNAEMITRRRGHGTRSSSTDINSREDRGLDAVEAWGVAQ